MANYVLAYVGCWSQRPTTANYVLITFWIALVVGTKWFGFAHQPDQQRLSLFYNCVISFCNLRP